MIHLQNLVQPIKLALRKIHIQLTQLIARKKGWEGRVVLQTDVDKQGNVKFKCCFGIKWF